MHDPVIGRMYEKELCAVHCFALRDRIIEIPLSKLLPGVFTRAICHAERFRYEFIHESERLYRMHLLAPVDYGRNRHCLLYARVRGIKHCGRTAKRTAKQVEFRVVHAMLRTAPEVSEFH